MKSQNMKTKIKYISFFLSFIISYTTATTPEDLLVFGSKSGSERGVKALMVGIKCRTHQSGYLGGFYLLPQCEHFVLLTVLNNGEKINDLKCTIVLSNGSDEVVLSETFKMGAYRISRFVFPIYMWEKGLYKIIGQVEYKGDISRVISRFFVFNFKS